MVVEDDSGRGQVETSGDAQGDRAQPGLGSLPGDEGFADRDRRAEGGDDVAGHERQGQVGAEPQWLDVRRRRPVRPRREVAIGQAEDRLVDESGLHDAEPGRQSHHADPRHPHAASHLPDEQSGAAVERDEERQAEQQGSGVAGRVVVRGEVLRADRRQHEQADDGGPSTPSGSCRLEPPPSRLLHASTVFASCRVNRCRGSRNVGEDGRIGVTSFVDRVKGGRSAAPEERIHS